MAARYAGCDRVLNLSHPAIEGAFNLTLDDQRKLLPPEKRHTYLHTPEEQSCLYARLLA